MRFTQFLLRGFLCLAAAAGVLGAQSIAVLTGASGAGTRIPLYSADPNGTALSSVGTISPVPAGAFQVLSVPDGSKYYVLSNTVPGITSVPAGLSNPVQIATAITAAPVKAALSGDGKRLIVLTATNSYIIDTATDTLLNSAGFGLTGTPVDVAFSLDRSTAYILTEVVTTSGSGVISSTSGKIYITPIDLSVNTAGTPYTLTTSGHSSALTTAPNGLLYLTTQNALVEINPKGLTLTATIQVNGFPGKVQFTSDSGTAVALNSTTGSAIIFDVVNRKATLATSSNLTGALDHLVVATDSRIFAFSSASHTLFDMSLGGGFNETSLKSIIPSEAVVSVLASNEVPAKALYIVAISNGATAVYKVDLSSNIVAATQTIPTQSGQLLGWFGANPTSGAATVVGYNTTQTVVSGGTSLPLVARVRDSSGRAVFGALVTFTATNGAIFSGTNSSSSTAFTNADGFAQVYAVVGTLSSTVTASSSNAGSASYTLTVPDNGGSGSGTGTCTQNCTTAAGVTIVRGNGQMEFEQSVLDEPLEVLVTDASGNGVAGTTVVFSVTLGSGTLGCPYSSDGLPGTCSSDADGVSRDVVTDQNGYAAVKFVTSSTGGNNQSFASTTVKATATAGTANFTEITVLKQTLQGTLGALPLANLLAPGLDSATGYRLITGRAGQTIAGAIQVQVTTATGSPSGAAIPGVALNVSGTGDARTTPSATCAGGTPLTDSNGTATCNLVLGPVTTSSPFALNVTVGSVITKSGIAIIVNPGLPDIITKVSGDGVSSKVGQTVALKATVKTSDGTLTNGTAVTWSVSPSTYASLSNQSTATDSSGVAQATLTLGTTPGTVKVTLTAGSGSTAASAVFTVTIAANAPTAGAITATRGNGQSATVLTAFTNPLVVTVTDTTGAALAGATVAFSVTTGTATLTTPAVTGSNGQTSVTVTAGSAAGTITVTATVGSVSTTFTLTAVAAGPVVTSFRNGAWPGNFAAWGLKAGLSPCSIAIVSGTGLATGIQGTVEANSFIGPLPTTLANVSLTVNGIPAPIFWVSNTTDSGEEVAFQTPCEVTPGSATVGVTVGSSTTTVQNVSVVAFQPGIFEATYNSLSYAVLLHANGSYVDPTTNPAHAGEALTMFVTGLGPVSPATYTNAVGIGQTPTALITVGVNNAGVPVTGAQYLPGGVGIYTISFQIPTGTPAGRLNLALIVADPANPNVPIYAKGSFVGVQ